jgi:hypothetical protein
MNYHFTSGGYKLTHKASPIPNAFRHAPACGEIITHSAWAKDAFLRLVLVVFRVLYIPLKLNRLLKVFIRILQ